MSNIKIAYKNILETSTVTLATGTENSTYPLYRIYDRLIGRIFKSTAVETITIKINQGATGNIAIDRLIIPAGHNLNGMTLDIKYSDNDSDYYATITQWVQGDALLIDKSWVSSTHRYWKFIITSPAVIPEIPELFLTQTYEFEKNPIQKVEGLETQHNFINEVTASGADRFITTGAGKKKRAYRIELANATQKANIIEFNNSYAGIKPFWLYDHESAWIYGKLEKPLDLATHGASNFDFDFNFKEVIS